MSPSFANHARERERFVDDLLGYMSLDEKIGQLILVTDRDPLRQDDERGFLDQLHRGVLTGVVDIADPARAERLQRLAIEETRLGIPLLFAGRAAHGCDIAIPVPVSAAASWDIEAIEQAERVIGEQTSRLGINWVLEPIASMTTHASQRGFANSCGESAWLCGHVTAARLRGLQSAPAGVIACLRDDDELNRELRGLRRGEQVRADQQQMMMQAIDYGRPKSLALTAFSQSRSGVDMHNLPDSQAGEFSGIVLERWQEIAVRSGHEIGPDFYIRLSPDRIRAAVADGGVDTDALDTAARQVLGAKFDLGLFRPDFDPRRDKVGSPPLARSEARGQALDLARKAIVLLRNDPTLLPLSGAPGELLVVGVAAKDRHIPMGNAPGEAASVVDGLESLGIPFKFVPGLAMRQSSVARERMIDADRMAIGMAGEAARRTNTVLVVLGEDAARSDGDGLSEAYETLLTTLRAVNDRLVLLTLGPRPLDPEIAKKPFSSVVHAGQLGSMSGHAIVEILVGKAAPTGRLPYTITTSDGEVRLPFGHGLTYTEFALADFSLELGATGLLACATLHNTGDRDGEEIVQLYIRLTDGGSVQTSPELKGFRRIPLAGESSERVTIEIGARELGQYDTDGVFRVEPGEYEIRLARNAVAALSGRISIPPAVAAAIQARAPGSDAPLPFTRSDRREA